MRISVRRSNIVVLIPQKKVKYIDPINQNNKEEKNQIKEINSQMARSKRSRQPTKEKVESPVPSAENPDAEIEVKIPKKKGRRPKLRLDVENDNLSIKQDDDGVAFKVDPEGEKKIDSNGILKGGREFILDTFTLKSKGDKMFILVASIYKVLGFKERHHFVRLFPNLPKIGTSLEDREELIEKKLMLTHRRTLAVNIMDTKTAFIIFGHHLIKEGKPIIDDYYENPDDSLCKVLESSFVEKIGEVATNDIQIGDGFIPSKSFVFQSTYNITSDQDNSAIINKDLIINSCSEFNKSLKEFRLNNSKFYDPHTNLYHIKDEKLGEVTNLNKISDTYLSKSNQFPIALRYGQQQHLHPLHITRFGQDLTAEDREFLQKANQFSELPIQNRNTFNLPTLAIKQYETSKSIKLSNFENLRPSPYSNISLPLSTPASVSMSVPIKTTTAKPSPPISQNPPVNKRQCGAISKLTGLPCTYIIAEKSLGCRYHKDAYLQNKPNADEPCTRCHLPLAPLSLLKQEDGLASKVTLPMKRRAGLHEMMTCSKCKLNQHVICNEIFDLLTVVKMRKYDWVCNDCKVCLKCNTSDNEATLLICDSCDRPWHMGCLTPKIEQIPKGGWHCQECLNDKR